MSQLYTAIEEIPSVDDFVRLRKVAGLTGRPRTTAEKGLPNSLFGIVVKMENSVVGMGRVVGDGGLNFEIVDVAVDPEHQGRGIGHLIMEKIMSYLEQEAPEGAYITLMADVPELYGKYGFKLSRPKSEGMFKIR